MDAIIHLAGETIAGRWNAEKKRRIRESRVTSTQQLVALLTAAETKPSALVCASAIGYYGDSGDAQFTETSPAGTDFLAEVCQEWEEEALKATELGIRVVTVRIGLVLGNGGGLLAQVLPPFKMGVGGKLGSGNQWMSWIHVDDVVGILLHAMDTASVSGALNATAPAPVRNIEFTKTLGAVLGRPTLFPVPKFGLKLMMGEFADFVVLRPKNSAGEDRRERLYISASDARVGTEGMFGMKLLREMLLSEYGKASSTPSPINRLMTDFAVDFRDGWDINLGAGLCQREHHSARTDSARVWRSARAPRKVSRRA